MANISDVNVTITAKRCGKEVQAWLKAVDKQAYYNICDDHKGEDKPDLGENSKEFGGVANGRWTYETNINNALSPDTDDRMSWSANDKDTEQAYQALIKKINDDHQAELLVEYEEAEPGLNFIGEGMVHVYHNGTKVATIADYQSEDLTIKGLIYHGFASDQADAREYLGWDD